MHFFKRLGLILFLLFSLLTAACSRISWQPWNEPNVAAADLPGKAQRSRFPVLITASGETLDMEQVSAQHQEVAATVRWYADQGRHSPADLHQLAQHLLQQMLISQPDAVETDSPELNRPFSQWQEVLGRHMQVRAAVYVQGEHIIQAFVIGPESPDYQAISRRVFETLKLR